GTPVPAQVPGRRPPAAGAGGVYATPQGARMPPCPQLIAVSGRSLPLDEIAVRTPEVTLALAAENDRGQWAGWSNPAQVALTPVAPAPALVRLQLTPRGVRLFWRLPQPPPQAVVIYRQSGAARAQAVAHVSGDATQYLDPSTAWNQNYTYWLRSAAGRGNTAVVSADSRHLRIRSVDIFPPPAPTGLEAVLAPNGAGVVLSWNAVSAPDLAGYNVFRRLPGSRLWQKRNAHLLPTPVFHDFAPVPGTAYAVTAVSSTGHPSQPSAPVLVH
ncbi:MAG: hypothetical protein ACRD1Y_10175, partial [Terriglobales bacterium]